LIDTNYYLIKNIKGSGNGPLCNGYLFGEILVDSPKNSICPDETKKLIITHPHCDHFSGAINCKIKKYASNIGKKWINSNLDKYCLCKYIGWDFPKIKIDYGLEEGEIIKNSQKYNELSLEVISTPGHCDGGICLYNKKHKILFSGDSIFPDYLLPRIDLPTSSSNKLVDSYKKLIKLDINIIYPGHGKPITEKNYISKLMRYKLIKQLLF